MNLAYARSVAPTPAWRENGGIVRKLIESKCAIFKGEARSPNLRRIRRQANVCRINLRAVNGTFADTRHDFRSKYYETCFQIDSQSGTILLRAALPLQRKRPVNLNGRPAFSFAAIRVLASRP
ncbi:hypothetical protein [Paraburkholderia sp. HD33-4]|uniref:hypothetical protein n=1 Tax=Paraburkholderia sp. HD33-4 TaxID=2883242 RepID=UPI001F3C362E|nr:hypothetical protein [Paraburkholderia sp. HD33-4]